MNVKFDPILGMLRESDVADVPITVVANYAALPNASLTDGKFYWCEASQGTKWLPGTIGGTYYPLGIYYSNGVSWTFIETPYQATQAEVNAGIVVDKFITPYTFANSTILNSADVEISWVDSITLLITGTEQVVYSVPEWLNGKSISSSHCFVTTPSTSGLPTFVIRNLTTSQTITSTAITINENAYNSYGATTPHVINPLYKVVNTGDRISIDCTVSGTGTKGAAIVLKFIP